MTTTWEPERLVLQPAVADEVEAVERRLAVEFGASVPPEVVHRCVADVARRFEDSRVRQYVPVLVERIARRWLRDAVAEAGHQPGPEASRRKPWTPSSA